MVEHYEATSTPAQHPGLNERFHTFRQTHPYTYCTIHRTRWRYLACGQGPQTLLMLPGAPGLGETSFEQITQFEQSYRVIALDYPVTVSTVREMVEGVIGILNKENIAQVAVIGGSYGGMVAQCLIHHHPERVDKLMLSHTGTPRKDRAVLYSIAAAIISHLPRSVMGFVGRQYQYVFFHEIMTYPPFWRDYFLRLCGILQREDYVSRLLVHVDFDRHYTLRPWHGPVLLIEADNDTLVSEKEREFLKQLYLGARVHTFHDTAHSAWLTHQEEYTLLISNFLGE